MGKKNEVATVPSQEKLDALRQQFPQEQGFDRVSFPRIVFKSQDVTEGKGKAKKVLVEAGEFILEEPNDNGVWEKEELGKEIEGIILFQRKQLRHYEEGTGEFTSSPIFDNDDEVLPLFKNKERIAEGTPAELKKEYEFTDKKGKTKSTLEENRVLYILFNGKVHQMNLRGSSMWSFVDYARKTNVPAVMTRFNSEYQENGSIEWNKMTFEIARELDAAEVDDVLDRVREIKESIEEIKAYFASRNAERSGEKVRADEEFEKLAAGKNEDEDEDS